MEKWTAAKKILLKENKRKQKPERIVDGRELESIQREREEAATKMKEKKAADEKGRVETEKVFHRG